MRVLIEIWSWMPDSRKSLMSRPMSIGAEMQAGKRRSMKMHYLVVSCLAVAYLAANVYAIVKVGAFELARSRKHLLLLPGQWRFAGSE